MLWPLNLSNFSATIEMPKKANTAEIESLEECLKASRDQIEKKPRALKMSTADNWYSGLTFPSTYIKSIRDKGFVAKNYIRVEQYNFFSGEIFIGTFKIRLYKGGKLTHPISGWHRNFYQRSEIYGMRLLHSIFPSETVGTIAKTSHKALTHGKKLQLEKVQFCFNFSP